MPAADLRRLPYVLLGWTGADGLPMVVPVRAAEAEDDAIALQVPSGLVPRAAAAPA